MINTIKWYTFLHVCSGIFIGYLGTLSIFFILFVLFSFSIPIVVAGALQDKDALFEDIRLVSTVVVPMLLSFLVFKLAING